MRRTPVIGFFVALVGCDDGVGPDRGPPAATIELEAPGFALIPGDTIRLSAIALTADDEAVPSTRILWTTADPSIATVDSTGLVTARSAGITDIAVQADDVIASTAFRVVEPSPSCTAPGALHLGTVSAPETWERQTGPHHVPDSLDVRAVVTVEPGTTICMGDGAAFHIEGPADGEAGLVARGTAQDSIVMTARTAEGRWEGVVTAFSPLGRQSLTVSHVRIERARSGIIASGAEAAVDSSLIRDIENAGVGFGLATGRVLDTVIESAGTGVSLSYANDVLISATVIRGTTHSGVLASRSSLRLRDVRIEGAGSAGISLFFASTPSVLLEASDVTVTGGATHPAGVDGHAATLLTDPTLGNRLTGNANDTIIIHQYAILDQDIVVRAANPWRAPSGLGIGGDAALRLEPGATLVVGYTAFGLFFSDGAHLIARGTPDAPVTLIGDGSTSFRRRAMLQGSPDQPSEIVHANIEGMILVTGDNHALKVDSSLVTLGGGLALMTTGSRALATTIENASDSAAIILGASGTSVENTIVRNSLGDGIRVDAPNIAITECSVSGNAGQGVLVRAAAGVVISQCDFEQNGGAGVRNTDTVAIDARFNWWGDPAGPFGPSGDGVDGDVTVLPFRTTPTAGDCLVAGGGAVGRERGPPAGERRAWETRGSLFSGRAFHGGSRASHGLGGWGTA